ncbi:hypothetical protein I9W82_003986 [Candida metapsilosis]|uniref:ubiquitinyl hydrolase 1 n=1 Tax=Candida metapsilosis TaxID=273372 RepID=A0A8H7ZG68_9ASCO|nr:hypothetical protein I9W82_003986 [Candida metapsilosis]
MTFASTSPSKMSESYLSSKKLPPPPPPPDPPAHNHHYRGTAEILKKHSPISSIPISNSTSDTGYHQTHGQADTRNTYSPDSSSSSSSGSSESRSPRNGNLSLHDYNHRVSTSPITSSSQLHAKPTPMQPSGSTNSILSQEDIEHYYTKLINYEFRNLQLDTELQKKSLFDLIDYCESLYEVANESTDHLQAIKSYTKGFLIFNYFINSFVMFHFDGFDAFIESDKQDFIIYLNIFAFYNTDQIFQNGNYTVSSTELRSHIKSYLTKKNLLSFNLEELYDWLFQYIKYLHEKDQVGDEGEEEEEEEEEEERSDRSDRSSSIGGYDERFDRASDLQSSNAFDDELSFVKADYPPAQGVGRHSRESSLGSIDGFKVLLPPALLNQQLASTSTDTRNGYHGMNGHSEKHDNTKESSKLNNRHYADHQNPYPKDDIVLKLTTEEAISNHKPQTSTPSNATQRYTRASQRPPIPTSIPISEASSNLSELRQSNGQLPRSMPNGRQHSYQQTGPPIYQQSTPMPTFPPPQPQVQPPQQSYPPYGRSNSTMTQYQQYPPNIYQFSQQQYHQPNYPQYFSHPSSQGHPMIPAHVLKQQEQIKSRKMTILKDYAVCGLKNFGSSCYINSTIQMLFGVYAFKVVFNRGYQKYVKDPSFIKIMQHPDSHKKDSVLMSEAIAGLLRTFQQNGGVSVSPTKFIRVSSLLKPDFNIPHEQQDSQEFLLFLLERLHAELCDKSLENFDPEILCAKWNINVSVENQSSYFKWWRSLHEHEGSSPISDLFQGHLQNKLRCNKCNYESITYSTFSILSLPIPNTKRPNDIVDLTSCLSYYIQDETLSGENAWRCPKCHGEVPTVENHPVFVQKKGLFKLGKSKKPSSNGGKAPSSDTISTKSLSFVKLPSVLFIHLSRFSMYNLTDKLSTPIRYPIELRFNNQGHEILYKISGVINHFGNLKSGHYTALINKSTVNESKHDLENLKHPCWCNFDDENVRPNVNNGTLRLGVDGQSHDVREMISTDVYVLCYERVDA